jgi:hypothetical protein
VALQQAHSAAAVAEDHRVLAGILIASGSLEVIGVADRLQKRRIYSPGACRTDG